MSDYDVVKIMIQYFILFSFTTIYRKVGPIREDEARQGTSDEDRHEEADSEAQIRRDLRPPRLRALRRGTGTIIK